MKKVIALSTLAVLALAMLLPVANQVNSTPINQAQFAQGGRLPSPPPPGSGGLV